MNNKILAIIFVVITLVLLILYFSTRKTTLPEPEPKPKPKPKPEPEPEPEPKPKPKPKPEICSGLCVKVDNGIFKPYKVGDVIYAEKLITFSCHKGDNECLPGKITANVTSKSPSGIWLYYSVDGTVPPSEQVYNIYVDVNKGKTQTSLDFTFKPTQKLNVYFNNYYLYSSGFSVQLV